jgi:hypothetical protein
MDGWLWAASTSEEVRWDRPATAAAMWGGLAASSLIAGCHLTLWIRPSVRAIGLTLGFGARGLTRGSAGLFAADALIDRRGD